MPKPKGDLYGHLSKKQLAILRSGYDEATLLAVAQGGVTRYSDASSGWVGWLGDVLYDTKKLAAIDRERCLIFYFGTQPSVAMPLAVHVYWGLCAGMSDVDIAQTLLLMGNYSGMGNFTVAASVVVKAETLLAALCDAAKKDAAIKGVVDAKLALTALVSVFEGGVSQDDAIAAALASVTAGS